MSEEEDWKSTVNALVRAKQELAVAWALVDEVGAEPAVEEHLTTALGAIDRAFATTAASTPGAECDDPVGRPVLGAAWGLARIRPWQLIAASGPACHASRTGLDTDPGCSHIARANAAGSQSR